MTVRLVKGYEAKRRNSGTRHRKRLVLIASEGDNKTEKLYFRNMQTCNRDKVTVRFTKGNETDPTKMMSRLIEEFRDSDPEQDDWAFCLVDSDFVRQKDSQMKDADLLAEQAGDHVKMIVSNPTFEIWYVCHYKHSTKQYSGVDDVLNTLRKYIPGYQKSTPNIYMQIQDRQIMAITNAKRLETYCISKGCCHHTVAFSPSTEIFRIIEEVLT